MGNLGLPFLKLARLFGKFEFFLSLGLLQLVELALEVLTLVLSGVQLRQSLVELVLQLALERLLLELVLVHEVRKLGLGSVSVLPQIFLNAFLFHFEGFVLADQSTVSFLHLSQLCLALLKRSLRLLFHFSLSLELRFQLRNLGF